MPSNAIELNHYKSQMQHRIILDSRSDKERELLETVSMRSIQYAFENNIPFDVYYGLILRACFEN